MSTLLLFDNNASSLLASAITNSQTTLAVTPSSGGQFPAPSAGQAFYVTVEDTSGNIEVMQCTGRTGDTLTVVRAAESVWNGTTYGATALAFASGSRVEQRVTAAAMNAFLQKNGGDTLTGTTNLTGILQLGSAGSIQGGEFTGALRSSPGVTGGQITVSGTAQPLSGGTPILTQSNIVANLPSGYALNQTNMIVMWAGLSTAIPSGWHLCDGTNGTPNLTDSFIVGGGGVLPTSGPYTAATAGTQAPADSIAGYQLTLADLPSHVHPFDYFFGNSSAVLFVPGGGPGSYYLYGGGGSGTRNSFAGSPNTGAGTNAHVHTLTPGAAHTHAQSIPYKAVFLIMKL